MAQTDERSPEPGVRNERQMSPGVVRRQEWRACTLALIAGYADAYGFIYYQAYVSFMSGNTTQSGLSLGRATWTLAVPTMVAIASFVAGVFAGTLVATSRSGQSLRSRFGLVAAIMAGIIVATDRAALPIDLGIMLLSCAMGIMNTTLSQVGGEAVALGYVSGTLNALARHLALAYRRIPLVGAQGPWDTHGRRALVLTGVWLAFLTGAALSAAASVHFGVWVLALPVIVLASFAALDQPAATETGAS
jgi:uncharacterized membrane protein YoaK (UPF0700 family)